MLLLFKEPVQNLFDKFFVEPIFSHLSKGWFADIIFFICIIYASCKWFLFNRRLNKNIDFDTIIISLAIALYYALYRFEWFGFNYWEFNRLQTIQVLRYFDIFLIYPAILMVFTLTKRKQKNIVSDKEYFLYNDEPISNIKDDELKRSELAEYLTKYILNNSSETSFAIGLNAKWGDGKTSFQNMIKYYLKNNNSIIQLDFNPWQSNKTKEITNDFFQILSDELEKYDIKISKLIQRYSSKLTSYKETWWSKIINDFYYLIGNSVNDENLFNRINSSLKTLNRKIVVYVDDLDRLNYKEILEVIKLIRNSANFRNIFFVAGFDKDYITEALSAHTDYGSKEFLEKSFQIQFELGDVPSNFIIEKLKECLIRQIPEMSVQINELLSDKIEPLLPDISIRDSFDLGTSIPVLLKNLRDVRRFSNFFSLCFKLVKTEVIFEEYFYIWLIKFKYSPYIKLIKQKRDEYFPSEDEMSLRKLLSSPSLQNKVEVLLKKDLENLKINEPEIKQIIKITKSIIFPQTNEENIDRRSIIFRDNLDIYLDNTLSQKGILFKEIISVYQKDWIEIRKEIGNWISNKKGYYLTDILKYIDYYSDKNKFEKIIKSWVYIFNKNISGQIEYWITLLKDENRIKQLFPDEKYKDLVRNLYNWENDCFYFVSYSIRFILRHYLENDKFWFPLSKKELQEIAVKYLKHFIDSRTKFDIRVFNLFYYNCWDSIDLSLNRKVNILKQANEIIREYIFKYQIDFLRFVIRATTEPIIEPYYTFEPYIPEYFNGWSEFEDFLNANAKENSEFIKMVEYFSEFKKLSYINFFSANPPEWIEIDENSKIAYPKYFKDQTLEALIEEFDKKGNAE